MARAPVRAATSSTSRTEPATGTPCRQVPCFRGSSSRMATGRSPPAAPMCMARTTRLPAEPAPTTITGVKPVAGPVGQQLPRQAVAEPRRRQQHEAQHRVHGQHAAGEGPVHEHQQGRRRHGAAQQGALGQGQHVPGRGEAPGGPVQTQLQEDDRAHRHHQGQRRQEPAQPAAAGAVQGRHLETQHEGAQQGRRRGQGADGRAGQAPMVAREQRQRRALIQQAVQDRPVAGNPTGGRGLEEHDENHPEVLAAVARPPAKSFWDL